MRDRFRVEVDDRYGTVALIIDPPPVTPGQQAALDALAAETVRELAALPGVHGEAHARQILLAEVTRQYADRLAAARVRRRPRQASPALSMKPLFDV